MCEIRSAECAKVGFCLIREMSCLLTYENGFSFQSENADDDFFNTPPGGGASVVSQETSSGNRGQLTPPTSFMENLQYRQTMRVPVVSPSPTGEDARQGLGDEPTFSLSVQALQQARAGAAWPAPLMVMPPGMPLPLNSMPLGNLQQQGYLYGAPNPLSMTVDGQGQQQSQQVAILPNPFMAMAAAGVPMLDRTQFMEAAFAARANNRKRQTQAPSKQAEKRRERNRVLAKKTRDRKKDHLTELQEELLALQKANTELKAMVLNNIDEKDSTPLLDQCNAVDKVPQNVWEACGADKKELAADDLALVSSIQKSQTAFVITDPSFEDNPIVFVSPDFLALTGYTSDQVIGRNCRFLQGDETSPDKVDQIRRGLAAGEDVGVTLINYKADGTAFWNRLFIAAVRDINDAVVNYMGVAIEVTRPQPEDPEYGKELPS